MLRVTEIKRQLNEDESILKKKIAKKLGLTETDIIEYTLVKEAIDARKKNAIVLTYTVDVRTTKDQILLKKFPHYKVPDYRYQYVAIGNQKLRTRPVVVGTGPCGLFAALILAEMGYRPIVLERGKDVDNRVKDVMKFWENGVLDEESNVQFGEGGAGTFSDGKLTTQIKNNRCRKVLEEFVEAGAPSEILYKNKPHIGTDVLRNVVKNIRKKIETLGGEIRFLSRVTDIHIENKKIKGIVVNDAEIIETKICILAIGHSARDTFMMLHEKGVHMSQKPFSIGMRIEHLQEWINYAQYGKEKDNELLGAADYKLVHHAKNGRTVYSFCMCPGGYVIASTSEKEGVVTNGMSEHLRDATNANSAILVNVGPSDFIGDSPLAGVQLQRTFEKLAYTLGEKTYKAPVQRLEDFLNNTVTKEIGIVKPTYLPGVVPTNIREKLPQYMQEALVEAFKEFGKKLVGFDHPDALLTGFETRSSSPVRIERNSEYQSNIIGLYPSGEGAGYAGGITSAAVDGIEVAEAVAKLYDNSFIL